VLAEVSQMQETTYLGSGGLAGACFQTSTCNHIISAKSMRYTTLTIFSVSVKLSKLARDIHKEEDLDEDELTGFAL
jgi:hypothetical protein